MREIEEEGWGKKMREWNQRELLQEWREHWTEHVNTALEQAGVEHEQFIDHRTLEAQGIDRAPEPKIGAAAYGMEQRGIKSERGAMWRAVMETNVAHPALNVSDPVVAPEIELEPEVPELEIELEW